MSAYKEGDLVEAKRGDRIVRDRLVRDDEGDLLLQGAGYITNVWMPGQNPMDVKGYTLTLIERAPVPLPTESGYYLSGCEDSCGGILQLADDGQWWWVGNNYQPNPDLLNPADVVIHQPLTRMLAATS